MNTIARTSLVVPTASMFQIEDEVHGDLDSTFRTLRAKAVWADTPHKFSLSPMISVSTSSKTAITINFNVQKHGRFSLEDAVEACRAQKAVDLYIEAVIFRLRVGQNIYDPVYVNSAPTIGEELENRVKELRKHYLKKYGHPLRPEYLRLRCLKLSHFLTPSGNFLDPLQAFEIGFLQKVKRAMLGIAILIDQQAITTKRFRDKTPYFEDSVWLKYLEEGEGGED